MISKLMWSGNRSVVALVVAFFLVTALGFGLQQSPVFATINNCTAIYNQTNGWIIEACATDPSVPTSMAVTIDGVAQPQAAFVRISHRSQLDPGIPQIAVIYASGYVRLKQNADPNPPIPFGTSFVLGPAYWPDETTYHHNPQLLSLQIDTSGLPEGPLRMQASGRNQDFDVAYTLSLPAPQDRQTRLHVQQTYTATTDITIDPTRRAEQQGFKLVQFSSMFINDDGPCEGGQTACHDADTIRFIGNDLARHERQLAAVTSSAFILTTTVPLGNTWLDLLHSDNESWQGNTPNARIVLDALPADRTITPQGWLEATNNPNDDNVGVWLHDDGPASEHWAAGQQRTIGYWLLAQDNPPDPWTDRALRPGKVLLDFENGERCQFVHDAAQSTTGTVQAIAGYNDIALQLEYDLKAGDGNWVQIRCNFDPPLDLSAYDHLRFAWRGDSNSANSLEVALVNPGTEREQIFGRGIHQVSQRNWWGQWVLPFAFLSPWTPGTAFDPSQVSAFFISVVKDGDDTGGVGRFAIDNINTINVRERSVPSDFENVNRHSVAAIAAANWLATQQRPTGLLKSWEEESRCTAHIYDQALALFVFVEEGKWSAADNLVQALATAQNSDGSWFKSYNCDNGTEPIHVNKWEGDVAWAVFALGRYLVLGGNQADADAVRARGAQWLATRLNSEDGCLIIDHTEGTIDVWWALYSAGPDFVAQTEGLRTCLLTHYWDEAMGRFRGGRSWQQPYLDNQTWGAAFLMAIGDTKNARRALSYAKATLLLPSQGGQLWGFDGQGGPWSLWNEGTAQYSALGGEGAVVLLQELLAQQQSDGAMPGSPDEFSGAGVWTTRWYGVAPTAWFYFAIMDGPFYDVKPILPQEQRRYLPTILMMRE